MDGSDGENPVKIGFPNRSLFKCESCSQPALDVLLGRVDTPLCAHPAAPALELFPKSGLVPTGGFANFPLLPPAPGTAQSPLWNPPGTTSHEAFPVLSWIHLSGSEAQRCPLSPQLFPSRMLWEHKALPGFQSVLDATQRIPFIPTCLFLFHQHTQT